ncbi:MAG: TIM barrel protein [Caldilineaceae bacterium SB0665_bin_25]|nr:TIM barrel protein [Caldilineaceae bacterium SB0665_bin_25]
MRICSGFYRWSQHYGWHFLTERIDEVAAGLAQAGYAYFEGLLDPLEGEGDWAGRWHTALDRHGVRLAGAYVHARVHDEGTQAQTIETIVARARLLRPMGAEFINANPQPIGARKTDEMLTVQAQGFARLGAALRREGLRLVVHHHLPELAENGRELRHLLEHTDAGDVGLTVDADWMCRGGQDAKAWIREFASRLEIVELRSSRRGIWDETLGDGEPDCREMAQVLNEVSFDGWLMVELAREEGTPHTVDLVQAHAHSLQYAREIFGRRGQVLA